MVKRAVLVLLMLWCCWGGHRLYMQADAPEATNFLEDPPTVEEAARSEGARLTVRELPTSGSRKTGGTRRHTRRPPPPWLASQNGVLDGSDRARFVAWLKDRPTHILDFVLRDAVPRPVESRSLSEFAHAAGTALGTDPTGLEFVVPVLIEQLRVEAHSAPVVASLLGALIVLAPVLGERGHEHVVALVRDAKWPDGVRTLAVLLCLQFPTLPAKEVASVLVTVQMGDMQNRRAFGDLIEFLKSRGAEARGVVPALLTLHGRTSRGWWARGRVLEALFAIAPDDPRVLEVAVRALGSNGYDLSVASAFLHTGGTAGTEALIAHLEGASGGARVQGVSALLGMGVPATKIGHLLLSALTDKSKFVRTKAVGLLARSGLDAADVIPGINKLLRSEKEAEWLTATQALGALSRMAGDRRPVIDLLFAAVRMPSVQVRVTAVQTLLMFDGENKRIIPLLADLLDDSEVDVRCEALDGLGELSAHDVNARRHVETALGDSDERVRQIASYWLAEEEAGDDED